MIIDTVKIILPAVFSFGLGIILTPILTGFLYKHKFWKKKSGKKDLSGKETPVFNKLHDGREVGVPRMGGVIIWLSALLVIVGIWLIAILTKNQLMVKLDFLSRDQTWIPLLTLIVGSIVGLWDDYLEVSQTERLSGGLSLKKRLLIVVVFSLFIGGWFFFKLGISGVNIPLWGVLNLGWLFIPFVALVSVAIYSGGVIDGIDGLAGGIFATIFSGYAIVAFSLEQINLASFCAVLAGAILAFLWFNIPPARFYMSETGTMGLTLTLSVVAFMTDTLGNGFGIMVLPIIAFPLVATSLSNIIQLSSKHFRGKKVFLAAPLHHHFEAKGWPPYKITMRFWIIGVIFTMIGVILSLLG